MHRARESAIRKSRFISVGAIFPQPERTQAAQQQNAAEVKRYVQEKVRRDVKSAKWRCGPSVQSKSDTTAAVLLPPDRARSTISMPYNPYKFSKKPHANEGDASR